jgi:spermidine synthase
VAFYGVELVYLLGLGAWLAWTGAGSLYGRRSETTAGTSPAAEFALLGILAPLSVALLRAARRLLLGLPGADLSFERGLALIAFCLMPTGFLLGLLFRRSTRRARAEGLSLAACYAIESAGAVLGGALSTLALALAVDALSVALACGLVGLGLAALLADRRRTRWLLALPSVALLAALPFGPDLDRKLTRIEHPGLVESRDTPYARLAVVRRGEQAVVLQDGATVFDTEATDAEALVHPVLVQVRPGRVLILGGCVEGLLGEALRHAPREVGCVELDAVRLALGRRQLGTQAARALDDPRASVTVADPRAFLARDGSYDAILVGMPGPESGQANRFYTREFFELCARSLAGGGVLGLRLHAGENYWAPLFARRMASIAGALRAVFSDTLLLPGDPTVLLATRGRLLREPAILATRLRERGIEARLAGPEYMAYAYDASRLAEVEGRLRAASAPINTDARPVAYGHAAALWLARFFPQLAFHGDAVLEAAGGFALAAVALGVGVVLLWRSRAAVLVTLMAVAGFAGMVLESVLLLRFQSQRGALFQDIGLLITAFMAGLAAGSGLLARPTREAEADAAARGPRAALLGLAGLALLLGAEVSAGLGGGLAESLLWLGMAGSLVGALFAVASRSGFAQPQDAIRLYAADLGGACLGSLLASLLLVPALGLAGTSVATAALCLVAAALAR